MGKISELKSGLELLETIVNKLKQYDNKIQLKIYYWGLFILLTILIKPAIYFVIIFKPLSFCYSALLFFLAFWSFSLYLLSNKDMYKRQYKATIILVITSLIMSLCVFYSAIFNEHCFIYAEINLKTYFLQIKQFSYHNGLYNYIIQTLLTYILVAFKFFQLFYFVYLLIQEYYLFNIKTEFLKRNLEEFSWRKFIIKIIFATPLPFYVAYDLLTNIF